MKKVFFIAGITALVVINSCQKADRFNPKQSHQKDLSAGVSGKVAIDWYRLQCSFLLERNSTLNGAYFGYLGIGLYEASRFVTPGSVSFSTRLYHMPAMPAKENKNYNWEASANAAMASLVRSLNKGLTPANLASIDSLENAYNQRLAPVAGAEVFSRSQSFGRTIATAIYDWYLTDDINLSNVGYVPPVFDGAWVPTLPALANGISPYVSKATPFLAADLTAIAPPFPYAYSLAPQSDFYKMVKQVYDVSKTLTQDQKNIALFWNDQGNGVGYTPGGHQLLVVVQALEQKNANLAISAESLAKAGIAEREAIIVCFRSKYANNLMRPITYIRDFIDSTWMPFIATPPHPEYPAAHACVTGTVMDAVTKVMGDQVKFTDHAYDFRGWPSRTYSSLFQVAEEAGMARLYGGIHYLNSIKVGLILAHEVGGRVGEIKLYQ